MGQLVLVAQLRDDAAAIAAYERYHADVWPEVIADNAAAGVRRFAIYRRHTTLVLVLDVEDSFSLESYKLESDRSREWLERMDELVVETEGEEPGVRWVPLAQICSEAPLGRSRGAGRC